MVRERPTPPPFETAELLPTQRIGLVVMWLSTHPGHEYTTAEMARYVGMTWAGMYLQLCKLSGVLPLRQTLTGWSFMCDEA